MRPYNDIDKLDIYKPLFGFCEYIVLDKNDNEKMLFLKQLSNLPESLNKGFWKKNTDSIFNNRVQIGEVMRGKI